jgi:hypothetical protein
MGTRKGLYGRIRAWQEGKDRKRLLQLVVVIIVVILISTVVVTALGGQPGGKEKQIVPEGYLDQYTYEYSREPMVDDHLLEGESISYEFFPGVFPDVPEGYSFYLDTFWLLLEWSDEGDAWSGRFGYENAPDSFALRFWDEKGYFDLSIDGTNVHGERGVLELQWTTAAAYFCVGDRAALGEVDAEVDWDDTFFVEVALLDAGDQASPYIPIEYVDEGGRFALHWGASGLHHEPGYED